MRWILCGLLVWTTVAVSAPVEDDLDRMLKERGLINQITDQLSQQIANQFSGPLQTARSTFGGKASELVIQAMGLLGVPYKRGGMSEEKGFDCSGFVRHMFEKSVGLVLPRRAEEQAKVTEEINRSELKPGDLVFFNTMKRTFSHVGIYVGDGKFIHAPRPGKAVRVDDMREAYWQKRFNGARRVQSEKLQAEPAQN
ncbi:MAG: peptidoglycan endopeptidase [Betaproteobacteria bacterium]|jgi:cell wall-associated NlpC family hydrolase|nr:peptidoglycan endopeptidase [Betaproteobacteria bacterium]NDD24326.1 peptidoglycan endopeptidase [Betaproteobacteria bacterium]